MIPQLNLQSLLIYFKTQLGFTVPRTRTQVWLEPLDLVQPTNSTQRLGRGRSSWAVGFASHGPSLRTPSPTRFYRGRWIKIVRSPRRRPPPALSLSLACALSHGRGMGVRRWVTSARIQRASAAHLMRLCSPPPEVHCPTAPVALISRVRPEHPRASEPLFSSSSAT